MPTSTDFTTTAFSAARERLISRFRELRIRAFLTTALPNIRYLTGFTGSNGALLLTDDRALLFTDPRYAVQAPAESDCEVKVARGPLLKEAHKWMKRLHLKNTGFERNRLSFDEFQQLKELSGKIRLKPLVDEVERLRMVKTEGEIAAVRASVKLNSQALEKALQRFKPGKTTEAELASEIEYRMRQMGADGPSFGTIVASGGRTAQPHARPTSNPVPLDDLLLVDVGATVAGYSSDMTRTYATGKLDGKRRQMYKAVLQSQLAAIDAIKPGVQTSGVDRAARSVLREYGWDKLFVHSTGHGLGLEIHESPRVGRKDKTKLEAGMIITVEPGIYEEDFGGIRIEDTVLVTSIGCEPLTPTGKELTIL